MVAVPKNPLKMEVNAFTLRSLYQKIAEHKGLTIDNDVRSAETETFKQYDLDENTLSAIAKSGIRQQDWPEDTDVFSILDGNDHSRSVGNYWNFWPKPPQNQLDLRIGLRVVFNTRNKEDGVIFYPLTSGASISPPPGSSSHFRMFKALVDSDSSAIGVAKEIAASDGTIVVPWSELGLGRILKIGILFFAFADGNKDIEKLRVDNTIFDPLPCPLNQQPGESVFVAESVWQELFDIWDKQLEDYRGRLVRKPKAP